MGAGDKRKGDRLTLAPTLFPLFFCPTVFGACVCEREGQKDLFCFSFGAGTLTCPQGKKSSPCVFNLNLAESEKKIISCAGKRGSRDSAKKRKNVGKKAKGEKYKKDSSSSLFSPRQKEGGKEKKVPQAGNEENVLVSHPETAKIRPRTELDTMPSGTEFARHCILFFIFNKLCFPLVITIYFFFQKLIFFLSKVLLWIFLPPPSPSPHGIESPEKTISHFHLFLRRGDTWEEEGEEEEAEGTFFPFSRGKTP